MGNILRDDWIAVDAQVRLCCGKDRPGYREAKDNSASFCARRSLGVMKLPRDVGADQLIKALKKFGYSVSHIKGSHVRITTQQNGEHHETIPKIMKSGTLRDGQRQKKNVLYAGLLLKDYLEAATRSSSLF
jgi:predicted RNA binding protein YcfA (HicA-like mRNA interferase family)